MNWKKVGIILIALLLALIVFGGYALENEYVVRVIDGDTFELEYGACRKDTPNTFCVRMAGIDTPEHYTRDGEMASRFLARLIEGKEVDLDCEGRGYYGRKLCEVYYEGTHINSLMIKKGLAEPFYR